MPIVSVSSYRCPWPLRGPHGATIWPNVSRRRFRIRYERSRLELSDGDFVDLDRAAGGNGSEVCLVALHGLEGSSSAPYVKSLARLARRGACDVVALNMRGCSGALNRKARFYHSGETGDLRETIAYLATRYNKLALVGFSLGGNVALKYLGEESEAAPEAVRAAVAISAPVDLAGSARRIGEAGNAFYMRRFIRLLSAKIEAKAQVFPEEIDSAGCRLLRDFEQFDGRYTAPLCGFESAEDYWERCSSLGLLSAIRRPALLINAKDDPFLSPACFPVELAERSPYLHGCFPEGGGHLGFPGWRRDGLAWHERVAWAFLAPQLGLSA